MEGVDDVRSLMHQLLLFSWCDQALTFCQEDQMLLGLGSYKVDPMVFFLFAFHLFFGGPFPPWLFFALHPTPRAPYLTASVLAKVYPFALFLSQLVSSLVQSFSLLLLFVAELTSVQKKRVISTGGGAPCFFNNMDVMNANGKTIYINVSPKELALRLSKSGTESRPLLANVDDLEREITDKLKVRSEFYEKAHFVLTGDRLHINDLLNLVKYS